MKRLFRFSSLSAIRVVSSAYLRLLIFLSAILIPACASSSSAFRKLRSWHPVPSWQINGETVETVADFILGGSKITADGDCSHKIKRHFLFGRKVMTNLDRILKSKDITLPTKVCLVKVMVFPVVMYGCESWL